MSTLKLNTKFIREVIQTKHDTLKKFCAETGFPSSTLNRLLHDGDTRISTLDFLAKTLDVSAGKLLKYE